MRILHVYVRNFGNLNEFNYDFQDGLNTIMEKNGWGKSTLFAFIRAMFYGLDSGNKQSVDASDRKHYTPWNEGPFGGTLIFENDNGKRYRIVRTFGAKESQDTYELIDDATGSPSEDYPSNIGEKIFKLDKASFERSVLIPQSPGTREFKATDSINARLTNLMESGDDIDAYDVADSKLEAAMKELRKNGGKGKLDLLEKQRTEIKVELSRLSAEENSYEERGAELHECQAKRTVLSRKLDQISERLQRAAKYETAKQLDKDYKNLCTTVQAEKEKADAVKNTTFAAHGVPSSQELDQASSAIANEERIRAKAEGNIVTEEEEKWYSESRKMMQEGLTKEMKRHKDVFAPADAKTSPASGNVEDDDALIMSALRCEKRYREKTVQYAQAKERLTELTSTEKEYFELQKKYMNLNPEEDLHRALGFEQDIENIDLNIEALKEKAEEIRALQESTENRDVTQKNGSTKIFFGIAAVLVVIGVALGLLVKPILFLVCLIGVAVGVYGWMLQSNDQKKNQAYEKEKVAIAERLEKLEEEINTQESHKDEVFGFVKLLLVRYNIEGAEDIKSLQNEIRTRYNSYMTSRQALAAITSEREGLTKKTAKLSNDLKEELAAFEGLCPNPQNPTDLADEVEKLYLRYPDIAKRRETYKVLAEEIDRISGPSKQFFGTYFPQMPRSSESLSNIKVEISRYVQLRENYNAALQRKTTFEKTYSVKEIAEIVKWPAENTEKIKAEREGLEAEVKQIDTMIALIEPEFARLEEQVNRYSEEEQKLSFVEQQITELNRKYQQLDKTRKALANAKSVLAIRYLRKLNENFDSYMALIDPKTKPVRSGAVAGKDEFGYVVDEGLGINVETEGVRRELGFMSTGYRDLIMVCIRLALVDAMFEEESPFIVMDDPFVNLDGEKLVKAKQLLNALALKHQVVYFTCHESRR